MTNDIKKLCDDSKQGITELPLYDIYKNCGYGSITITFINGEITGIDPQIKFKYGSDYNDIINYKPQYNVKKTTGTGLVGFNSGAGALKGQRE